MSIALAVSAPAQETERVSVDSSGNEANNYSCETSLSSDGRFVAFGSAATNLVAGDTNGEQDVFVHDRQAGVTTRVSVSSTGDQANRLSECPAISEDGRFVTFSSFATNLVTGDSNGSWDIFVHELQTGMTTRVSVDSGGDQGNNHSFEPAISGDGRFVAFDSHSDNLIPGNINGFQGDTNNLKDVFVHDRQTEETVRVSTDSTGAEGNGHSDYPAISADGRVVAFWSWASNLVTDDTNGTWDVFVHDTQTGSTTRVSVSSEGIQGNAWSDQPSISHDGRFVAFESTANNLVHCDNNGFGDIFVHDRENATTTRVSIHTKDVEANDWSGHPSISSDGRSVTFWSQASNLVPVNVDTNNAKDIFVHELSTGTTSRLSVASTGSQTNGDSDFPAISGDGRVVSFRSSANNLVPNDNNRERDNFVHGPYLTLDVSPEYVTTGDPITFTTWTGLPSGLAFLVLVDVNGHALFQIALKSTFDGAGIWTLSGKVPPGLSGNVLTFKSLGVAPTGKGDTSNTKTVTFQ